MLTEHARKLVVVWLIVALVAAVGLGVAGSALQPVSATANGGSVVGKSTFAYLTGLRTFVAAVLWNRLDPQYHDYYGEADLSQMKFMLPTMRMVQLLDPNFLPVYFVGAWIVARQGHIQEGLRLARDGLAANPDSGLMRANLVTLLQFAADRAGKKNEYLAEQLKLAVQGVSSQVVWASPADESESMAIFRDIFKRAGKPKEAAAAEARRQALLPSVAVPTD